MKVIVISQTDLEAVLASSNSCQEATEMASVLKQEGMMYA